ncbi:MAG: hypothetical protein AMXMBFR83_21580 [Phycisphaerae bacterium]
MKARDSMPVASTPGRFRRWDATGIPPLLARLVLGGLFIYMGQAKAHDPGAFLKQINEYHLFASESFTSMNLVAAVLPWLEIYCGALLILGVAVRGTSLLVLIMLAAFSAAVGMRAGSIYQAGQLAFCAIKFDCGCGGGEVYICRKLLENAGLLLLSIYLLWSRPLPTRFALFPALFGGGRAPDAAE